MSQDKIISSKRKIKQLSNIYTKKGDELLHPLTLQIFTKTDNKPEYATELYYYNKKPQLFKEENSDTVLSKEQLQTFMALPYLNLDSSNILNIYNINSSDELINFINKSIQNNTPPENIYRIINTWIYDNFEDLIKYNNILNKIIQILDKNIWKKNLKYDQIDKDISKWFNSVDINDFNFNFINLFI